MESAEEEEGEGEGEGERGGEEREKYPCGSCALEVRDDDEAIYCESGCEQWYHRWALRHIAVATVHCCEKHANQ